METSHPDWLPYWQPNYTTTQCSDCHSEFNWLSIKRHHCRECGKIFCQNCWGKLKYVKVYDKEVPVCNNCFGKK